MSRRTEFRRAGRVVALAAVFAVALGGCSLFSSGKPKPAELPVISGQSSIQVAWRAKVGAAGSGFEPAVAGNRVWAASRKGNVAMVDADTGQTRWQADLDTVLVTGAGSDGSLVAVGARDGTLIALGADDGKQRWRVAVGAEIVTVPAVGPTNVIVRSADNRISAFDAASGKRRWSFQRQAPALVLRQTSAPLMAGSVVYAGLPGGRIVALDQATGALRWEAALTIPRGSNEIERISDVVGTPVLVGNQLCAGSFQGRIGCLDAVSGRSVWVRDLSTAHGPDADERMLVATDARDQVHAYSGTGQSLWRNQNFALRELSAPLLFGSQVLVGDARGLIHALDRDDGAPIGRASTDSSGVLVGPKLAGKTAVVLTADGELYGIRSTR